MHSPLNTSHALAQLLAFAAPKRAQWLGALALMLVAVILGQLVPFQIPALTALIETRPAQAATQAVSIMLVMVLLIGASAALLWAARRWLTTLGQDLMVEVRAAAFESLLRQGPAFYRKNETGQITAAVMNDVETLSSFSIIHIPYFAQSFGQFVMAFLFMCLLSWPLALASVLIIAVIHLVVQQVVGPPIQHLTVDYQRRFGDVTSRLSENLTGVRDIQLFTQERRVAKTFRHTLLELAGLMKHTANWQALSTAGFHLLNGLGLALIYGLGVWVTVGGILNLTSGMIGSLALYFGQLTDPVFGFSRATITVQSALAAARRIVGLITTPPDVQDTPEAINPGPLRGHIRFENVTFSYQPQDRDAWRVKNLDLDIHPGEKVAFVGGSGSGKSTILNLVQRFYDVTSGSITVDGHDLRQLKLSALREQMALVGQNVVLFRGTIADNIRFGNPSASQAEVEAAARVGDVVEFIEKLDDGYNTMLGELGAGLSGGQKQRVSVARAALRQAPILLLDEATSALDNQSEDRVTRALDTLSAGRTTLIVTHRLHTVRNADKIVMMGTDVFGDGVILAVGTHDELLENSPDYAALYGRSRRKSIMMPLGPMYDTTAALPTVIGLASAYGAPVYLLDFGQVKLKDDENDDGRRFGMTQVIDRTQDIRLLNLKHEKRLESFLHTLAQEGIIAQVVRAQNEDRSWVEATIQGIKEVEATHFVAVDNVMVAMDTLRESIRTIERKSAVEYILVNPVIG